MYAKGKLNTVPSDAQAQEKLALYVYEYLVHIGAQKSAQTFLSEIHWDKNITLGEPPGFLCSWWCVFWDLYCAAPERRDNCEHSGEATAFHDYNFANAGCGIGPPPPMHPPPGEFFPPPPLPPPPPSLPPSSGGRNSSVGPNGISQQRLPPPLQQQQQQQGGPMQYRPPPRSAGSGFSGGQMMCSPWQQQQQQDPRMIPGPNMPPPPPLPLQQQLPEQQQTADSAAILKIKESMQEESELLSGGSGFDADFFSGQQP